MENQNYNTQTKKRTERLKLLHTINQKKDEEFIREIKLLSPISPKSTTLLATKKIEIPERESKSETPRTPRIPRTPKFHKSSEKKKEEEGEEKKETESPTVPLLSTLDPEIESSTCCCPPCPPSTNCPTIIENICLGVGAFAFMVGMSSMFMNCIKKDEANNAKNAESDIENQMDCL